MLMQAHCLTSGSSVSVTEIIPKEMKKSLESEQNICINNVKAVQLLNAIILNASDMI